MRQLSRASAPATEGLDVSLDEIARRAGVARGTVHRRFAELVDTVLAASVGDLVVAAKSYVVSEDVGGALRAFLVHVVTEGAAAHELAARLQVGAGDLNAAVQGRSQSSTARWASCCSAHVRRARYVTIQMSETWLRSLRPRTRRTSIRLVATVP